MRFRTFILWTGGLALLGWAGYTAVSASSAYLAAREMVDQVLREATPKGKAAAAAGGQQPFVDFAPDVREIVLIRARRYAIPLDERDLAVWAEGSGIRVRLKWSYPVMTYGRNAILVLPMSVERSVSVR